MLTECFKTGAFDHSATRPVVRSCESVMVVHTGAQAQERSVDTGVPGCQGASMEDSFPRRALIVPHKSWSKKKHSGPNVSHALDRSCLSLPKKRYDERYVWDGVLRWKWPGLQPSFLPL